MNSPRTLSGCSSNEPHATGAHRKAPRSSFRAIKVLVAIIAAAALLISATTLGILAQTNKKLTAGPTLHKGSHAPSDGATDIVLVGNDSRIDDQGNDMDSETMRALHTGGPLGTENTDTIVVVRVFTDGSPSSAISIPRDTYVHDDQFGNMKINGVYAAHKAAALESLSSDSGKEPNDIDNEAANAGRTALISAVNNLTGITADHYAEIGLTGFVQLTNAVGGVDVCLKNPTYDSFSGTNLPAGEHTLDGVQALHFVRQRHGLPGGDLDRIARQQAYLSSLSEKATDPSVIGNPAKMNSLIKAVESTVTLDKGWNIMSFASRVSKMKGDSIQFSTIPVVTANGVGDHGESIVEVDTDAVKEFVQDSSKGAAKNTGLGQKVTVRAQVADDDSVDNSGDSEFPVPPTQTTSHSDSTTTPNSQAHCVN